MSDDAIRLLNRPAAEGARLVALRHLEAARLARRRLGDRDDGEALHDFRVALRRLRTGLRSFRPQLDPVVSRKARRRLRDLSRSTGGARDAEVQIAWIQERRKELPRSGTAGVPWLLARLVDERDHAYEDIRGAATARFDRLEARLGKDLENAAPPRPLKRAAARPVFATVLAARVREHAASLARRMGGVRSVEDDPDVHAARIQAKRLRYLLEPVATELPPVSAAVEALKRLQDALGELRDLQMVIAALGDAAAAAAAERARRLYDLTVRPPARPKRRGGRRVRPASAGLLALTRVAVDRRHRAFGRLTADWVHGALPTLLREFAAIADALETPPPAPVARLLPPGPAARRARPARRPRVPKRAGSETAG